MRHDGARFLAALRAEFRRVTRYRSDYAGADSIKINYRGEGMTEKITATFWYPGSFFSEDRTVTIPEPTLAAAVEARPDDRWFAVEVKRTPIKTFRADDGEERVLTDGKSVKVAKWYVGEEFTVEEVEALGDEHRILVSNMRGNGWATVCRTRCGNWQPVEEGDVVLADAPDLTVRGDLVETYGYPANCPGPAHGGAE